MTRRYRTQATPAEFDRISRSVTLRDAAQSFCRNPTDVPETMRNALHEAAHVVLADSARMHAQWVYIPRRSSSGSRISSGVPSGKANACSSFGHSAPADAVSALEEAAVDLSGCVADGVTDPHQLPPIFAGTTDVEHADDCIERYLRFIDRIAEDPMIYARVRAELQTPRFAATADVTDPRGAYFNDAGRDAVSLFARHFELIDATAAIILACADSRGNLSLFKAHLLSDWVRGQIRNAIGNPLAHRQCEYQRPAWLRAQPLCTYATARAEYKRLGAIP